MEAKVMTQETGTQRPMRTEALADRPGPSLLRLVVMYASDPDLDRSASFLRSIVSHAAIVDAMLDSEWRLQGGSDALPGPGDLDGMGFWSLMVHRIGRETE